MLEEKKLSVIIPVYNLESYLERCINSILNQTYQNLEVICVNDGSTDNSLAVLNRLAAFDKRVCVISQENAGVSAARNTGIDHATGDYITFVDGDDAIAPEMYSVLVQLCLQYDAEIAHCGYRRINPDGTVKDIMGTEQTIVQNSDDAVKCLITGQLFVGSLCNKIYRKTLFKEIRLDQHLKINEDIMANIELFHNAERAVFYDAPLYLYYIRPSSVTNTSDVIRRAQDMVIVSNRIFECFKGSELEGYAANRLFSSLTAQYRTNLYLPRIDKGTLAEVKNRIKDVYPYCRKISLKQKLNFRFLTAMPYLYKVLYKVYDRIRIPNWDVN